MKKFVHFITYSKAASYVAALLCVVSWFLQRDGAPLVEVLYLLLPLFVGYMLIRVNREFSFSDTKNTLPATLFFMGCSLMPRLFSLSSVRLHFVLFAVACYMLLLTYRDREAMGRYFLAFVLVGVQCLLLPSLLLVLPWLVVCGAFMESLHGRTLLAALWGLLCPFWVVWSVLFLTDRLGLVAPYMAQVMPVVSVSMPAAPHQWGQLLWPLLIALPGSVGVVLNHTMKLQASAGFRLLTGALVVILVAMWLSSGGYAVLLPCVVSVSALLGAALFTTGVGRGKRIFLLVLLLIWLLLFGLPLWSNC